MSSEFLKIDEFLLNKGFYKITRSFKKGTVWVINESRYEKENEGCEVEITIADKDFVRFKLYSKKSDTVDYCCVLESEIKWCYLEDLMKLLGM